MTYCLGGLIQSVVACNGEEGMPATPRLHTYYRCSISTRGVCIAAARSAPLSGLQCRVSHCRLEQRDTAPIAPQQAGLGSAAHFSKIPCPGVISERSGTPAGTDDLITLNIGVHDSLCIGLCKGSVFQHILIYRERNTLFTTTPG